MTINEALEKARAGNFVSHSSFSSYESLHMFKNRFYYEDGANLTTNGFVEQLKREQWAQTGWYVKYSAEKVDTAKLSKLHSESGNRVLQRPDTYENCIKKTANS